MNLKRMLNSYGICPVRKTELVFIILFIIVLIAILLLSQEQYKESFGIICQSEINLHSYSLNASGIHVIPSLPEKHNWFDHLQMAKHDQNEEEFNPHINQCVDVQAPGNAGTLLICIHDPQKDLMVSANLKNKGSWEPENVEALHIAHKQFPDMVLVDLGCNVGVFTLPAAKLGMEVIAVDSMISSLQLLQRSLYINGLSCHVTLIHNALYKKRMQMRVALDPTNIGGSRVVEILEFRRKKITPSQLVDAICLDDLIPLVKGRTVFLKIDLEGNERSVLECADEFFKQVNVKVLLIEWMQYRHNDEDSGFIKNFLEKNRMVPTWGVDMDRDIDPDASNSWPDNVFWMKRD